jgi:hypothetical protein
MHALPSGKNLLQTTESWRTSACHKKITSETHAGHAIVHVQSDLTYPYTSVLDEIADKVRQLDK